MASLRRPSRTSPWDTATCAAVSDPEPGRRSRARPASTEACGPRLEPMTKRRRASSLSRQCGSATASATSSSSSESASSPEGSRRSQGAPGPPGPAPRRWPRPRPVPQARARPGPADPGSGRPRRRRTVLDPPPSAMAPGQPLGQAMVVAGPRGDRPGHSELGAAAPPVRRSDASSRSPPAPCAGRLTASASDRARARSRSGVIPARTTSRSTGWVSRTSTRRHRYG